jgi:hypothetical protein
MTAVHPLFLPCDNCRLTSQVTPFWAGMVSYALEWLICAPVCDTCT